MDRRQVLLGMTAMGLAGPLNLGHLLSAQSSEANSPVSRCNHKHWTAREWDGLYGPVKTCVEDRDSGALVNTKEYGLDGELLSSRMEMGGKLHHSFSSSDSDSDWLESKELDSQARLVKHVYGQRGETAQEVLYTYDNEGRLLTSTQTGRYRLEYHYQADGSKIEVQTFDPSTIERMQRFGDPNVDSHWDFPQSGNGVPMGGTVTIIYDSAGYQRTFRNHDSSIGLTIRETYRPIEMQVRSADGQVVNRIIRTYDAQGRLAEEKTLEMNLDVLMFDRMPPEKRESMTPDQIRQLHEYWVEMGKAESGTGTTFAYDDQGRVTETRERNTLFDQTKSILHNERGEKIREQTTYVRNSLLRTGDLSSSSPEPSKRSRILPDQDIRYDYQYDSYRNWTERTMTVANDGSSVHTSRTSRVLTYY